MLAKRLDTGKRSCACSKHFQVSWVGLGRVFEGTTGLVKECEAAVFA